MCVVFPLEKNHTYHLLLSIPTPPEHLGSSSPNPQTLLLWPQRWFGSLELFETMFS